MKNNLKTLSITSALILSFGSSFAIAEENKASGSEQANKPDAYTVEDSKDGLTHAKKPVRKLHHKQKAKGDSSVESGDHPSHDTSGSNNTTGDSPAENSR